MPNRKELPPFRITPDNLIEFAHNKSACDTDIKDLKTYKDPVTRTCTYAQMSEPGTDPDCLAARDAIMWCSTGGTFQAYIPGVPFEMEELPHNDHHPLDYTSQEVLRQLRIETQQTALFNLLNKFQDSVQVNAMVEPFYNPNPKPYTHQRTDNNNYRPRHICQCVKPFYIPNNARKCVPIRVYNGYTLAGQKCNARVVDWAESPAEYEKEYICCGEFTEFFEGLVKIKYCNKGDGREPYVTVIFKVKLSPMKIIIPVTFHPPVTALMGACNSYVRMLALGLKYSGPAFRLELKRASKEQLLDWTKKQQKAADFVRKFLFRKNEKEVKAKVKNRQIQWLLLRASRDEKWQEGAGASDDEYNTWVNDCCFTSVICLVLSLILQVKFFGGKAPMCLNPLVAANRARTRAAWAKKYGLWKSLYKKSWWEKLLDKLIPSDVRLKTNVAHVGVSAMGIPMYQFTYQGDTSRTLYQGAMAQDLLRLRPDAVHTDSLGYHSVDYSKIDVGFGPVTRGGLLSDHLLPTSPCAPCLLLGVLGFAVMVLLFVFHRVRAARR